MMVYLRIEICDLRDGWQSCGMGDEIENLRKELNELRNQERDHRHEHTQAIGRLQGASPGIESRLDRLEKQIDNLLFLLIESKSRSAIHGRNPEPGPKGD